MSASLSSKVPKRICVFCGSSAGVRPDYAEAAEALGHLLASRDIGIVYGGSHRGLMGTLADAALAAGGEVIGVIPRDMVEREVAHTGLSGLRIVESMHERKALMADLADGFIAMPGGFGTLDEFCEILTWAQLGLHAKPCGMLNVAGFFDPLLAAFDHAVAEGFIRPAHRGMMISEQNPVLLVNRLAGQFV